jgi:hypothetical protein
MTALALSDLLPDFGAKPHRAGTGENRSGRGVEDKRVPDPGHPEIDLEAALRIEAERVEGEVTARLTSLHETALQTERERHAGEMEGLRAEFGTAAGALIAARMAEIEAEISAFTTSVAARILGTLLTEEMRKRSLARLAEAIHEALRDSDAIRIEVRGPQSLFEPLSAALGDRAKQVHYVETPGFDLLASIDGNLLETRLAEWSSALSGSLS